MPKNVLVQQFMSAQPITVRHDELLERVQELDIEFNEDEFQYWRRREAASRARR